MNPTYSAYGLTLSSCLPLPELRVTEQREGVVSDVLIDEGRLELAPLVLSQDYFIDIQEKEALLYSKNVGAFAIHEGTSIRIDRIAGTSDKRVRLFLLGSALAMLLHQRGQLVLHASGIALNAAVGEWSGIGFMGDSGEGKSTMGATLFERGHRALADDIIPLPLHQIYSSEEIYVSPGFPMFKLWPPSVAALYHDVNALPLSLPESAEEYPRRERKAERDFVSDSVPLRALVVLETGESIECRRLSQGQALMALIRNSYWSAELPPAERAVHFRQCTALAQKMPVYSLRRPRDLTLLPQLAGIIESLAATNFSE